MTRTRIAVVAVTLAWVACASLSPIPTGPVPPTTSPDRFDPEVSLPHKYPNLIVVGFKVDSKGSADAVVVRGYDDMGTFAPSTIAVVGPLPTAADRANFEVSLRRAFGAT